MSLSFLPSVSRFWNPRSTLSTRSALHAPLETLHSPRPLWSSLAICFMRGSVPGPCCYTVCRSYLLLHWKTESRVLGSLPVPVPSSLKLVSQKLKQLLKKFQKDLLPIGGNLISSPASVHLQNHPWRIILASLTQFFFPRSNSEQPTHFVGYSPSSTFTTPLFPNYILVEANVTMFQTI